MIKVSIKFVIDDLCKAHLFLNVKECELKLKCKYQNEDYYSVWFLAKDRFGGDVVIQDVIEFQGYFKEILLKKSDFNVFQKNSFSRNIIWIGYFNDYFSANKMLKRTKSSIIDEIAFQRLLTPELKAQIEKLNIRK